MVTSASFLLASQTKETYPTSSGQPNGTDRPTNRTPPPAFISTNYSRAWGIN